MLSRLATRTTPRVVTASTSSSLLTPPQTSNFSTTTPSSESKSRRKSRLVRKQNLLTKSLLHSSHEQDRPDPILGYSLSNASLWNNSLLKSVLLEREKVWGATVKVVAGESTARTTVEPVEGVTATEEGVTEEDKLAASFLSGQSGYTPQHYNFGLSPSSAKLLLETLPATASFKDVLSSDLSSTQVLENRAMRAKEVEERKRDVFSRVVDLRNASGKGIEVENRRRIVEAFSRKPVEEEQVELVAQDASTGEGAVVVKKQERELLGPDTGRPEVQAAILTSRIHSLHRHLISSPRDIHNRRPLRSLVQQRVKVLKYLRSIDVARYLDVLPKIGVEQRAVEGEVVVDKKGLRRLIRGV